MIRISGTDTLVKALEKSTFVRNLDVILKNIATIQIRDFHEKYFDSTSYVEK